MDGTLNTRTDPLNQATTYTYDSYQRVTKVTHGVDATQTYNYTYDTGTNGYGRLTQVTWGGTCSGTLPVYSEAYSYTVAGEMSGKTLTVTKMVHGGCVQALATGSFTYDSEGKPTRVTYPEFLNGVTAPAASYTYDAMSRLTGVTDTNEMDVVNCSANGSVTWASGGTYNAAGQLTGVKRLQSVSGGSCPTAVTPEYFNQAWQYNSLNQLTEIDVSSGLGGYPSGLPNPGPATYFFAKYGFSATANNGQIASMQDARTGTSVAYTYDLLKRVTGAVGTGGSTLSQTFGYDGFGNLTSKSVPAGSSEFVLPGVNAAKNWLNGSTYDANGNVTTLNNATLSYDVENRLSKYTTGTFVENYAYDEGNRRVEKWTSTGGDNVYFYGPSGKLLSVLNLSSSGTLSMVANRIYFGGMLLGSTTGYANSDADVIKDRLGSVQPGYAYGTDTGAGQQMWTGGDDFATYLKDGSSGFEYAMNRYYSASYGRFLTVDPFGGSAMAGNSGSWNRYAYTGGDPVNHSDPTGEFIGGGGGGGDGSGLSDTGGGTICADPMMFLDMMNTNPVLGNWDDPRRQQGEFDTPICGGLLPVMSFDGAVGGSGGGTGLSVAGYSRTGANEQVIANVLNKIVAQALTGDCASWLMGQDFSAAQFVSAIIGSGPSSYTFGYANLSAPTIAAFVGNMNLDGSKVSGLPIDSSITVNSSGAFFNSSYSVGGQGAAYAGGTLQAQAFILVHELAHEVGAAGMQPDYGNAKAGKLNNDLVQKNCGNQIATIQ